MLLGSSACLRHTLWNYDYVPGLFWCLAPQMICVDRYSNCKQNIGIGRVFTITKKSPNRLKINIGFNYYIGVLFRNIKHYIISPSRKYIARQRVVVWCVVWLVYCVNKKCWLVASGKKFSAHSRRLLSTKHLSCHVRLLN